MLTHSLLGKKPAAVPLGISSTRERATNDSTDIDAQSKTGTLNASFSHLNTKSTKSSTSAKTAKVKQDPDTLLHLTIDESAGGDPDTRSAKVKVEIPDPIYPEEQEEGSRPAPRVDIEQINLVTDDEDDDSDALLISRNKGKGRSLPNKGGLKPVRLQREEHKERVTLVNTEPAATTLTDDAKDIGDYQAFVSTDEEDEDHIEFSRDRQRWSGVWQDDDVEVKHDPGASDDAMDVDIIENPTTLVKSSHVPVGQVGEEKESTASASVEKEKKKRRRKPENKQPVLQTEEDRAEHARHLEDLRILARELGGVQTTSANEKDAGTVDLDGESITGQPRVKDHEGRLYLFQFPPVLPSLVNKIKKEEATNGGPEPMEVEAGPSKATEAIDLTKPDPEEAVFIETQHGSFQVPPELVTEEGFVGKLTVRKSGRVLLDWGGTILELGRGVESDYLTTTMIVEGLGEEGSSNGSANPPRTGTGMGKVMGNFVLTPDFEAMGEM
jgi:DNA-directed RNA polymerase III subunit RPC4